MFKNSKIRGTGKKVEEVVLSDSTLESISKNYMKSQKKKEDKKKLASQIKKYFEEKYPIGELIK